MGGDQKHFSEKVTYVRSKDTKFLVLTLVISYHIIIDKNKFVVIF